MTAKDPIMKKSLSTVLGASVLVALLAGCSATGSPDAKPSATATSEAKSAQKAPVTGKCVDGQATIVPADLQKGAAAISDCEQVWVLTDNAKISVKNVANIGFEGKGNSVTFEGAAPEVQQAEDGGNTVDPAS